MLYMVSYLFIMRLRSLGFRSCFFSLLPSLLCIDFLIMCSLLYYEQPIYSYSYLSADIVFSFSSPIWNTSICFVVIPCRREWCQLYCTDHLSLWIYRIQYLNFWSIWKLRNMKNTCSALESADIRDFDICVVMRAYVLRAKLAMHHRVVVTCQNLQREAFWFCRFS